MDSGLLRILLIILGIALIASIYLWERLKKKAARRASLNDELAQTDDSKADAAGSNELLNQDQEALSRYLDELESIVRREDVAVEPSLVSAEPADDMQANAVAPVTSEPQGILTLSVVSRRKFFSGDAIMSAMRSAGLEPGPRNIFYRYTPADKRILYGIASMVEPGVFPLKNMSRFTTSGITLFASLPGERSGQHILDDMLATADKLAAFLDGIIHDDAHQPISAEYLADMHELAARFVAKND